MNVLGRREMKNIDEYSISISIYCSISFLESFLWSIFWFYFTCLRLLVLLIYPFYLLSSLIPILQIHRDI